MTQLKKLPTNGTLVANSVPVSVADLKRQHDYHIEMAQHLRRLLGYPPLTTGAQVRKLREKAR